MRNLQIWGGSGTSRLKTYNEFINRPYAKQAAPRNFLLKQIFRPLQHALVADKFHSEAFRKFDRQRNDWYQNSPTPIND